MDARLPERWLYNPQVLSLSDAAWRLLTFLLLWSVANRTGGVIREVDLTHIPTGSYVPSRELIAELEMTGWLGRNGDDHDETEPGWLLTCYDDTQTSAAQLAEIDRKRTNARKRKQRERDRKRTGRGHNPIQGRDSHTDVTRPDPPKRGLTSEEVTRDRGVTPSVTLQGQGTGQGQGITKGNRSTDLSAWTRSGNGHQALGADSRQLLACVGCGRPVLRRRAGQLRARGLDITCPQCSETRRSAT